jgi:hypothetical protein
MHIWPVWRANFRIGPGKSGAQAHASRGLVKAGVCVLATHRAAAIPGPRGQAGDAVPGRESNTIGRAQTVPAHSGKTVHALGRGATAMRSAECGACGHQSPET